MNPTNLYVRVLLVLIALVILLTFLNRDSRRGSEGSWVPSSYNPVGAGNMALFTTLQDLHWPVDRWREPLSRLASSGPGDTLVITRSPVARRVAFSEDEISILARWVKKGKPADSPRRARPLGRYAGASARVWLRPDPECPERGQRSPPSYSRNRIAPSPSLQWRRCGPCHPRSRTASLGPGGHQDSLRTSGRSPRNRASRWGRNPRLRKHGPDARQ